MNLTNRSLLPILLILLSLTAPHPSYADPKAEYYNHQYWLSRMHLDKKGVGPEFFTPEVVSWYEKAAQATCIVED